MLFVLVVLAALGAALANMSMRQHMGSAAELAAARAVQAARAGVEWAAFQVLRSPGPAGVAPACFASTSFALAGLSDFTVTVNCTRTPGTGTVSDGASNLVFFELVATACNAPSGGTCPSTASLSETYVERQLSWTVMR
jgi:MSHA biogenesis protein MshP